MLASGKVAVGPAQRPKWPEHIRIPNRRLTRHAVRGLPRDESLTRLESFFGEPGSNAPGYSARGQYRSSELSDAADVAVVRSATAESASTSAPRPTAAATTLPVGDQVEAVAQKLSSLTTEQLTNLQGAAHQAAEYISQLEQVAVASVGELRAKLQNSEGTLSSSLQKNAADLSRTAEAQCTQLHDALSQALEGLKQAQAAPATSAGKKTATAVVSKPSNGVASQNAASSSETPVGVRLQQELQDGIASLQQLTTEQLNNLQSAAAAIQSDVLQRTQQLTAALKSQAAAAPASSSKQASTATKSQATSQAPAAGGTPVGARLQQEVHDGLVMLQELTTQQLTNLQTAAAAIEADIVRRSQQITAALKSSRAGSSLSETSSVGVRLQQELQAGINSLQKLTVEQFTHLQTAAEAIQADVVKSAQQITAAVKSKSVPAAPPADQKQAVAAITKQRGVVTQQKRATSSETAPSTQIAALKNLSARGLENLQVAAQAVQHAVQNLPEKARAVRLPSVSMPSPSTFTDVSQLKSALVSNPWAFLATGAVLLLATLRRIRSIRRGPKLSSEEIAAGLAKSRRALDAQRNRFKQALSSGTVDSSVFSAVRKKGASVEQGSDDDSDSEEDAALGNPEEWDNETRRAWQSFVKSSKMSEGEMWDPSAPIDEGLKKVYVDLDKE